MRRLAFLTVVFIALFRFACLCWPHSFLRRGAFLPYTANGAHCSLRGWLLAIGDAGMAGLVLPTQSHITQPLVYVFGMGKNIKSLKK